MPCFWMSFPVFGACLYVVILLDTVGVWFFFPNKARGDAGSSAQKSLSESNNLKAIAITESKASFINISQMTVCVG